MLVQEKDQRPSILTAAANKYEPALGNTAGFNSGVCWHYSSLPEESGQVGHYRIGPLRGRVQGAGRLGRCRYREAYAAFNTGFKIWKRIIASKMEGILEQIPNICTNGQEKVFSGSCLNSASRINTNLSALLTDK
jgi:hypothetical protein